MSSNKTNLIITENKYEEEKLLMSIMHIFKFLKTRRIYVSICDLRCANTSSFREISACFMIIQRNVCQCFMTVVEYFDKGWCDTCAQMVKIFSVYSPFLDGPGHVDWPCLSAGL